MYCIHCGATLELDDDAYYCRNCHAFLLFSPVVQKAFGGILDDIQKEENKPEEDIALNVSTTILVTIKAEENLPS